jgi:hypothetical protein
MKALKSERADTLLNNPVTAKLLREATARAGYGLANVVIITVPCCANQSKHKLSVYYVPKAKSP